MITRIVFHSGAGIAHLALCDFFSQLGHVPAEMGVVYPEWIHGPIFQQGISRQSWEVQKRFDQETLTPHLAKAKYENQHEATDQILLFSFPFFHFASLKKIFIALKKTCDHQFPNIPQEAILTITRQDQILDESIRAIPLCNSFGDRAIQPLLHAETYAVDYSKSLEMLNEYFSPSAQSWIIPGANAGEAGYILSLLFERLGIEPNISQKLLSSYKEKFFFDPPREVAYFAGSMNLGCVTQHGDILRWSPYVHCYAQESGYRGAGGSMLGPVTHAEIMARNSKSNAKASSLLGMPSLFPDVPLEEDWKPWSGISPNTAYDIAERLPQPFIHELREQFEAYPATILSRAQRICLQAIREVSKPAGTIPLRRFAEQPAKVAVLTLTYNHADYIEDNIKSVLEQKTNFPIEHIIADDASTDGTREIILKYAEKYPHIHPVFQETRSGGWANVMGIFTMANSPYVALCDGDDYFSDPLKLQIQADYLDANPDCSICFHPVRVVFEDNPEKERIYPDKNSLPGGIRERYTLLDLIRGNFMQSNSVMYRWRFTSMVPEWFKPGLVPGDWYWHLLHAENGEIGFINRTMSVYRRHPRGIYYIAESNNLRQRYLRGIHELEFYQAINEHFKGVFWKYIRDMAMGVLVDMFTYASEVGDIAHFEDTLLRFPAFAKAFFESVKTSMDD